MLIVSKRHKTLWCRAHLRHLAAAAMVFTTFIAGVQIKPVKAASYRSPPNVLLSRARTEPVVAVDPRVQSRVVVAANTNYSDPVGGIYPTAYFDSRNGGRSFAAGLAPMVQPYTTGADSTVAIARDGTVFYSYLGEEPAYCANGGSAVLLTHSIDHGQSFKSPVIVDSNAADDKPNMAVEGFPGRPSHIFVTWDRIHDQSSDVMFARSLNGGASFSRPVELWTSPLDNYGSIPVVTHGGHVYVFWSVFPETPLTRPAPTGIFLRASADDGAHFAPRREVARQFQAVPRMAGPGMLRDLTEAAVAAAPDGTLFAAWALTARSYADGRVDANIVITRSTDAGRTWSRPRAVNDAARGVRFMPAIAVLSRTSAELAFYDQRAGGGELDVYATRVSFDNGFHASANLRVNDGPAPVADITYIAPGSTCFAPGRFFGDYIGVAVQGPRLCVVWADTQLQVPDETDIWFARVMLPRR